MSLAVLIPYRPDSPHRERIQATTSRLWKEQGGDPIYQTDGLTGLFSFARAANLARAKTDADCLITYNCDALPLPNEALAGIEAQLSSGAPWTVLFAGQQRFTLDQTNHLLAGYQPYQIGPAQGDIAMGREALLGIRADVWDDLRGMDERFVGWGPEDVAFHKVLRIVYPHGNDIPAHGLFQSLWHPDVSRAAWSKNHELWLTYGAYHDPNSMKNWYLDR